jgi:hypothetical protein
MMFGSFTDEFMERAFERAADIAERLWGVRPQSFDMPVPHGVPNREWVELLSVELEKERYLHRIAIWPLGLEGHSTAWWVSVYSAAGVHSF